MTADDTVAGGTVAGGTAAGGRSRERLLLVLVIVAAGALAVLCSTQRFATAVLPDGRAVPAAGAVVAPVVAPLGLVSIALAAALTIASPLVRYVLAAVLVLLGAGLAAAALPAVLHPAAGVGAAVSAVTGVSGSDELAVLTRRTTTTAWPVVAAFDGGLLVLAGVSVAVRSRSWPVGGRRFRADAPVRVAPRDPIEEWDALSAGADPTDSGDGPR